MAVTIYGIRQCDTMTKACRWLDAAEIAYHFHDYKISGIDAARLRAWCRALGWERVLNRSGTTFRKLPDAQRVELDENRAIGLMFAQPSMIKRPILEADGRVLAGFSPAVYATAFSRTE